MYTDDERASRPENNKTLFNYIPNEIHVERETYKL
jgi:hypothetical protein